MKVFICHSSVKKETALAELIATKLRSEGHTVFFDRTDLTAAGTYDKQIREAIRISDLFLLLLSPNSVKPGSYTLSELTLVRSKWPDPTGHVLPVMVAPTPIESIPPYVRAVSFLEPGASDRLNSDIHL